MSGTVEQQGRTWRYRVVVGIDPGTGARKSVTKGRFKIGRAAQKALNELLVKADQGLGVQRSNVLRSHREYQELERKTGSTEPFVGC